MARNIIIIEGGDGVGKETISKQVTKFYQEQCGAESVLHISAPHYESPTGVLVKSALNGVLMQENPILINPYTMSSLYMVDRLVWYEINKKDIENTDLIVMDRSWISNLLYQGCKFYCKELFRIVDKVVNVVFIGIFRSPKAMRTYIEEKMLDKMTQGYIYVGVIPTGDTGRFQIYEYNQRIGMLSEWYQPDNTFSSECKYCRADTDFSEFVRWEYNAEVANTFLASCDTMHVWYLYHSTNPESDAKLADQAILKKEKDLHEKSTIYRSVVNEFSNQIFMNPSFFSFKDLQTRKGVKINVHPQEVEYVSGDPTTPEIHNKINQVTEDTASSILFEL